MDLVRKVRTQKRLLTIFIVLGLLSSVPNISAGSDETICASKPCQSIRLQNPIIHPYAWLYVDKCHHCSIAENAYHVATQTTIPLAPLMNLAVGISYLFTLSFIIDFGITKVKWSKSKKPKAKRTKKKSRKKR